MTTEIEDDEPIEAESTFHCGHCGKATDEDGEHLDDSADKHMYPMPIEDEDNQDEETR